MNSSEAVCALLTDRENLPGKDDITVLHNIWFFGCYDTPFWKNNYAMADKTAG